MINSSYNNSISFGSTYKIDFAHTTDGQRTKALELVDDYMHEKDFAEYTNLPNLTQKGDVTYVLPNYCDSNIELYLKNNGINFKRYRTEELFSPENIKARMVLSNFNRNRGYKLVELKTKEFDELFKNSTFGYLGDYETMEHRNRYDGFIKYIKSNQPIEASEVHFRECGGRLNATFQDGRHRYAVLRDMDFKSIPFQLDKESLELAKKYNLLDDAARIIKKTAAHIL